jgi:hypothetical protein
VSTIHLTITPSELPSIYSVSLCGCTIRFNALRPSTLLHHCAIRWVRSLDVEDPLVEKLNFATDKHAAARKKDVKNKWWYAMVHPTEARGKVVQV